MYFWVDGVGGDGTGCPLTTALWHNTSSGPPEVHDGSGIGDNCCLGPTAFQVNYFQSCEDSFQVSL
jgi:hypothetical protein